MTLFGPKVLKLHMPFTWEVQKDKDKSKTFNFKTKKKARKKEKDENGGQRIYSKTLLLSIQLSQVVLIKNIVCT